MARLDSTSTGPCSKTNWPCARATPTSTPASSAKPSGEDARRLSFQIKAQPFKNTTLVRSPGINYKNASVRPNFTTPRDYYTDWYDAGKPAWNPVTRLVTLGNGQVCR